MGQLKGTELASLAAERGIQRVGSTHGLAYSLLRPCDLSLWYEASGGHVRHWLAGGCRFRPVPFVWE